MGTFLAYHLKLCNAKMIAKMTISHFNFRCLALFFNETDSQCHFMALASESLETYNKTSPAAIVYVNAKQQNCKIHVEVFLNDDQIFS
jgi:hypothetical protein